MSKFWNFANKTEESVDLFINGDIVDDFTGEFYSAFFGDESCTSPSGFREQLNENRGKHVNVYIDSYGGDVIAASSIYTMLSEHKGGVTVKISGIAASAASVIAMAGDKVLMSETAVMMIHNPSLTASGDHNAMEKAIDVLSTIKDSIINAYRKKTGLSRKKISDLMEEETWMDFRQARDLGFCDGTISDNAQLIPSDIVRNCVDRRMLVFNTLYRNKFASNEVVEQTIEEQVEAAQESVSVDDSETNSQLYDYLRLRSRR